MAATATRSQPAGKASPASKRSSSPPADTEPKLEFRYNSTMKPNRVHTLVVAVPRVKHGESIESAGMVVVRPAVPGALVTPAEQRLEMVPGYQIAFAVTPLARGRLSRACVEIFAPNQPTESVALRIKVKTQSLAKCFFLLALAVPMLLWYATTGRVQPLAWDVISVSNTIDASKKVEVPHKDNFVAPIKEGLPPVPLINRPAAFVSDVWKEFTLADTLGEMMFVGFKDMKTSFHTKAGRWIPNTIGFGFFVLGLMALFLNATRRRVLRHSLKLTLDAGDSGEASTLEPL